jgi:regulator of protease activity HflC (stomatin/prohibitin superfamily)
MELIKMKNKLYILLTILIISILNTGCNSEDIGPAHKGMMVDKTGIWALWYGGTGLSGPVLNSGTYYTGMYNTLRVVECSTIIKQEEMKATTKDGVQFGLNVYARYSVNCDDDKAVSKVLSNLTPGWPNDEKHPEWANVIFGVQLYDMVVRPALNEAIRKSVSTYIANEINPNRDKIYNSFKETFTKELASQKTKYVIVYELNLSNLDFPDTLNKANVSRAEQSILKDKTIAERDKVEAEIKTTKMKQELALAEGDVEAAKIDKIGEALKRNPDYLQFQLQQSMPEMYAKAGEKGNMIIAAPSPINIMKNK